MTGIEDDAARAAIHTWATAFPVRFRAKRHLKKFCHRLNNNLYLGQTINGNRIFPTSVLHQVNHECELLVDTTFSDIFMAGNARYANEDDHNYGYRYASLPNAPPHMANNELMTLTDNPLPLFWMQVPNSHPARYKTAFVVEMRVSAGKIGEIMDGVNKAGGSFPADIARNTAAQDGADAIRTLNGF